MIRVKILLVTGQLAKESVKKYVKTSTREVDVLALPVSVAALLTPSQIGEEILKRKLKSFDMILVPGLIKNDISEIEEITGIPAFKLKATQ